MAQDIFLVQRGVVGKGADNDTYILTPNTVDANAQITISDSGANRLQLADGLTIASSTIASNTLLLTLSNGAEVTILNASDFEFDVGGNTAAGISGTVKSYADFASQDLGTAPPAAGSPAVSGANTDVAIGGNNGGGQTGDAYTLTANTDVATANVFESNLVFTPGGDDRINALQDEDRLTGEGDNPTLNATLGNANDNGATVITPELNGIETVNVSFTGSGGGAVTDLDLQDATGLTNVNLDRVSQAVNRAEVANIQNALDSMSVSNSNSNQAGAVEFSYTAGALNGLNSTELSLSNVNVAALNIGQNTSGVLANGVSLQGYENLALNVSGADSVIGTLNLPMDTGSDGTVTITGDANLQLGGVANMVNAGNNALLEAQNVFLAGTGIAQAGGRLSTIDASAMTGNLTIVLDNILDLGKAETSGVLQNVTVTGGSGDDTFVLYDAVQAGDTISGGAGTDTVLFYSGSTLASQANGFEVASMFGDGSIGAVAADFSNLADVNSVVLRNISSDVDVAGFGDGVLENASDAPVNFNLSNLSATQATGISIQHSTSGIIPTADNGAVANSVINAGLATNTGNDTLGVTISEGFNVTPRFNFTIAPMSGTTFENVTLTDDDSESNSVELNGFAQHTGTITLTGGEAGDFLNLDLDTAGADVTGVVTGVTGDGGSVQQGLYGIAADGSATDFAMGNIFDVTNLATQVRLGAATIDASGEASNVIVRVGTNAASATGAQSITTGSGNDSVIFDLVSDARAGLTISDTVNGGSGMDTLVIDGHGTRISLGASEWTNVSNFEAIRLVGNSAGAVGTQVGQNSYNLALTNDLIDSNGGDLLAIINDNDSNNDAVGAVNTGSTGLESAVTVDARTLDASNHFSYNGEEGVSATADKFIFADANINGGNIIDGGAADNSAATFAGNADVIEVRNAATVTVGDLAGISNVGTIAGSNDQAVAQTLTLELNDTVVDALVDSYHASSTNEVEVLNVQLNAATDVTTPAAGMGINLDASALTAKSQVNVALENGAVTGTGGAADSIGIGFGNLQVTNFVSGTDQVVIDVSDLGLALDADDVGVAIGTDTNADGTNIAFGVAAAGAATDRLIFDTVTNGAAGQTDIYYDVDGNGAQAQVLIASIFDQALAAPIVAGDVVLVA